MNNRKTGLGILLLLVVNACILATRNMYILSAVFVGIYLYGYLTQSRKKTILRLRTFILIGISLLFFQLLFNQSIVVGDRIANALRVTMQIAIISQLMFIFMQLISLSALVSSFRFLPPTWQLLIAMTFSFIPVLVQEQEIIQINQRSRGLGISWVSRVIAPIAFFVPLLHRVLQRSETIGLTMVSRGFVEE